MALLAQLLGNQASLFCAGLRLEAKGVVAVTPEQAEILNKTGLVHIFEADDPTEDADDSPSDDPTEDADDSPSDDPTEDADDSPSDDSAEAPQAAPVAKPRRGRKSPLQTEPAS